jgi:hypothetical protein
MKSEFFLILLDSSSHASLIHFFVQESIRVAPWLVS